MAWFSHFREVVMIWRKNCMFICNRFEVYTSSSGGTR